MASATITPSSGQANGSSNGSSTHHPDNHNHSRRGARRRPLPRHSACLSLAVCGWQLRLAVHTCTHAPKLNDHLVVVKEKAAVVVGVQEELALRLARRARGLVLVVRALRLLPLPRALRGRLLQHARQRLARRRLARQPTLAQLPGREVARTGGREDGGPGGRGGGKPVVSVPVGGSAHGARVPVGGCLVYRPSLPPSRQAGRSLSCCPPPA